MSAGKDNIHLFCNIILLDLELVERFYHLSLFDKIHSKTDEEQSQDVITTFNLYTGTKQMTLCPARNTSVADRTHFNKSQLVTVVRSCDIYFPETLYYIF